MPCWGSGFPGLRDTCQTGSIQACPRTHNKFTGTSGLSPLTYSVDDKGCPTCLTGLLWGPEHHTFAKRSEYSPTGTTIISVPVLFGRGKMATKLDSPPFISAISQTGVKENGGGGVLTGKLQPSVKPNWHTVHSYKHQETNSPESGRVLSQRLCR